MLRRIKEALLGSRAEEREPSTTVQESQSRFTVRDGELTPTDEAFDAWTTRDLEKMRGSLDTRTNPVDRHFLLKTFVEETYKLRKNDSEAIELCAEVAEKHIEEFPAIKPALVKSLDGILPRVSTFQKYAILLTEQGKHERAIEVCEIAILHGLDDGTKGGFKGRIERIKKKASDGNS